MTLEQIQALTDEEIRVRVAELCGAKWQDVPPREDYSYRPKRLLSFHVWEFDSSRCAPLPFPNNAGDAYSGPNYPADLNACAEFASYLRNRNRIQYGEYASVLSKLVARFNSLPEQEAYHGIFDCDAEARTRCEAFLAVIQQPTT